MEVASFGGVILRRTPLHKQNARMSGSLSGPIAARWLDAAASMMSFESALPHLPPSTARYGEFSQRHSVNTCAARDPESQ